MLYIVTTPIGNMDDISARAVSVLREVDVIACEDTRRTRKILTHFEIPKPEYLVSYREGKEIQSAKGLVKLLKEGRSVALCSDSGCPGISDPGYRLICLAVEENIEFHIVPGASAVHVALMASGLSTSSYTFKGYVPRKRGEMERFFASESDMPHTIVVFESPYRVEKTLGVALKVLGDRSAAVCIELTKKFERISRGYLSQLLEEFTDKKIKGEVTIVISGNNPKFLNEQAGVAASTDQ